jgi:hypothetical protein
LVEIEKTGRDESFAETEIKRKRARHTHTLV